jgi:hypothetical protein
MLFEVIISTISTGRVQRKVFDTAAEAEHCAADWEARNWKKLCYRVETVRRELPAVRTVGLPQTGAAA